MLVEAYKDDTFEEFYVQHESNSSFYSPIQFRFSKPIALSVVPPASVSTTKLMDVYEDNTLEEIHIQNELNRFDSTLP